MTQRSIGPLQTRAIGFGCMSLSHAYGAPPAPEDAARVLHAALDMGYDFLDTAALYGFGANERLIGETLKARRGEYVLASKCGMTGVNGTRVIDGRPETLRATIDESLQRLQVEVIDLYYLHRLDFTVPIEESVGALAEMVQAGKIRAIGLSEVSAATIRRAHAVHPIAAVQNEYSPWSRNVEIGVLAATREIGAALVAFSPVARGFLADAIHAFDQLQDRDIRRGMPRFQPGNIEGNLTLLAEFRDLAAQVGCTPAQLA
ncbi:MAG: aldo/keto reductase, partial [Sphingomonas bacterium]